MFLKISSDVFNKETFFNHLDQVLILVENGMHELILEAEQEDEIMNSEWVKSLGNRHVSNVIELITKTIDKEQHIGLKEKQARGIFELTSGGDMSIAVALNSIIEPVTIIVEDIKSDAFFIYSLTNVYRNTSKRLRAAFKNGWVKFAHAGGKTHIIKVIEGLFLNKPFPFKPRIFVLVDSDKLFYEQEYNVEIGRIIEFCGNNNIALHVLFKREIENYIPETVLEKRLPIGLEDVLKAYKELSSEQKDYYDLEKGFNNKRSEIKLYQNLNDSSFNSLREGFSRDKLCDVKNEFYKMFEDEDFQQENLESRCSHQPNILELKNLIIRLSNIL